MKLSRNDGGDEILRASEIKPRGALLSLAWDKANRTTQIWNSVRTRASNHNHLLEILMTWDARKLLLAFAEEFIIIPAACSPNANIFQLNPTLTLVCRA